MQETEPIMTLRQYPPMLDATLSTLSHAHGDEHADFEVGDELVRLLECDQPLAGSSRHRLVDTDEVMIGRRAARHVERKGARLALRLADSRISTEHATIRRQGKAFVLADERSKNGVFVNGRRVDRQLLRDGDIIECGRTFFLFRVARSRRHGEPADIDGSEPAPVGLTTFHEPLAAQLRALRDVARTPLSVLILGDSGTGKELVSRAIHALSARRGAFVGVNCGALPENLVEAELFGTRKGAFTGASDDKPGLVRASDQGTLFLDEIGDLPLRAQPALLRVLQEREVLPIGSTRAATVDLRVVAATHRDVELLAREDRFRSDLLARLSGFVIRLPPLRERLEDFGLLTASLLARNGTRDVTISSRGDARAPRSPLATEHSRARALPARGAGAVAHALGAGPSARVGARADWRRGGAGASQRAPRRPVARASRAAGRAVRALDGASGEHLGGGPPAGKGPGADQTLDQVARNRRRRACRSMRRRA